MLLALISLLNSLNDFNILALPDEESWIPLIKLVIPPKHNPPVDPKNVELNPNFKASN